MYKLVLGENKFVYHVLSEGKNLIDILQYLEKNEYLILYDYREGYEEAILNGCEDNLLEYLDETMSNFAWNYRGIKTIDILRGEWTAYTDEFGEDIFLIPKDTTDESIWKLLERLNNVILNIIG